MSPPELARQIHIMALEQNVPVPVMIGRAIKEFVEKDRRAREMKLARRVAERNPLTQQELFLLEFQLASAEREIRRLEKADFDNCPTFPHHKAQRLAKLEEMRAFKQEVETIISANREPETKP